LVIETDDQTLESMRVMRNVNTLIGAQGVTFTRSFVNYSLCCPSRATFLTGQYAHNHRVWTNTAPDGGFGRFEALHAHNNLAIWLRGAGYHTAMIGKYLNGYENESRVPVGWSEWHALVGEPYRAYDYALNNNGTRVRYGHRPAEYQQDVLTRKASSGSPTRPRTAAPTTTRTRTPRPTAMTPPSRRDDTPTPSTPSHCRGRLTSTSPT
jgi:arylsulfatase A-like enzyme